MKNLRKSLIAALMLLMAQVAMAQMMMPLPVDKDVRIGKLDNGLTYYIRHNNWPEKRAEFYIAQRVGSIQENATTYRMSPPHARAHSTLVCSSCTTGPTV